jgi:hypothetical protein
MLSKCSCSPPYCSGSPSCSSGIGTSTKRWSWTR